MQDVPLYDDELDYEDLLLSNDGSLRIMCKDRDTAIEYLRLFNEEVNCLIVSEIVPVTLSSGEVHSVDLNIIHFYYEDGRVGWVKADKRTSPNAVATGTV